MGALELCGLDPAEYGAGLGRQVYNNFSSSYYADLGEETRLRFEGQGTVNMEWSET